MLFRDPIPGYAVFCVLVHIGTVEITEDGVDEGSLIATSLCGQHVQLDQLDHRPDGGGRLTLLDASFAQCFAF